MKNQSIEDEYYKFNFIYDYIKKNFMMDRGTFLKKFNVNSNDSYFNQHRNDLFYCEFIFFKLVFNYQEKLFDLVQIKSIFDLEKENFFVIPLLNKKRQIELDNFISFEDRYNFLISVVLNNSNFLQLLLYKNKNNLINLFLSGIDEQQVDNILEFITIENNIKNF